jgi:dTDP-4-amino-4,6-dideoxygalactose transaminase
LDEISAFSSYRQLDSARPDNIPVATKLANGVICLPMHHELMEEDVIKIVNIIAN